jgi:ubiquinone/menaquinone biosynthesis C-methylase UbiE
VSVTRGLYDATWGRFFAATYERLMKDTEEAGMRERRRGLVARAQGTTVELGAGTGLNFGHYPEEVTELVLTEPFEPMARRLRERAESGGGRPVNVIEAPADRLPLDDASADTVVCTLVLCTVDDVPATLAEVARVLKPGGRLLFAEHVRSAEPGVARWQDRLETPWRLLGHGCRCNRDTVASIERSPLRIESVELGQLPKSPPIVRPLAVGSALKPA